MTRSSSIRFLAAAALLVLPATAAAAPAPGTLDSSFSKDGRQVVPFGAPGPATAVALDPYTGHALVGGIGPGGTLVLSRLRRDGSLDPSWHYDGRSTTSFPSAIEGVSLRVLPNRKVAAAAVHREADAGAYGVALARLHADGLLDTGYGARGTMVARPSYEYPISRVQVQPDGRVLFTRRHQVHAGYFDGVIARLRADGTFDGERGGGCFCTRGGEWGPFAAQPDGKIVVDTNDPSLELVRYRADLTPDPSFGTDGSAPDMGGQLAEMVVQPDGRILAVGSERGDFYLERRLANGAPDPAFGRGGVVRLNLGHDEALTAVAVQPNGRIVGVGRSGDAMAVVRLRSGGALDTSFGAGGVRRIAFPGAASAAGHDVALAADGAIVAAGGVSTGGLAVARVWGDPIPSCHGRTPTLASGEALVYGHHGRDVIFGSVGDDRIYAGAGDDIVCSHTGDDRVWGETGADTVRGGKGSDRLEGGFGADLLLGEDGDDRLFGNADNDHLDGGLGFDRADGGPGTDTGAANEAQTAIP